MAALQKVSVVWLGCGDNNDDEERLTTVELLLYVLLSGQLFHPQSRWFRQSDAYRADVNAQEQIRPMLTFGALFAAELDWQKISGKKGKKLKIKKLEICIQQERKSFWHEQRVIRLSFLRKCQRTGCKKDI